MPTRPRAADDQGAAFLTRPRREAEDGLKRCSIWNAPGSPRAAPRPAGAALPAPPLAVDLLAATPLVSATSLAAGLGMAVKNAAALLDAFCAAGIAVEVTHRSARRLFGLAGLAPCRSATGATAWPSVCPPRWSRRSACRKATRSPSRSPIAHHFRVARDPRRDEALETLRSLGWTLPQGFRFDRAEANARDA